jgi:hypothetical protein
MHDRRKLTAVGWSNRRNCDGAQAMQMLLTLRDELGRTPTRKQFAERYGSDVTRAITFQFGCWKNFVGVVAKRESWHCGTRR